MRDVGMYIAFWKKYLPVIKLLLKKTGAGPQRLQFYKYELERTRAQNKLGYVFSIDILNGKTSSRLVKVASAVDLLQVFEEDEAVSAWLKENNVRISVSRTCEMLIEKLEVAQSA